MEARGEQIAGSRFVRDFCVGCNEPIRVSSITQPNYCLDCEPSHDSEKLHGFHEVGEKLHLGKPEDIKQGRPLEGIVRQVIK